MRTVPSLPSLGVVAAIAAAGGACEIENEIHPIVTPDDACVSECFPSSVGDWENTGSQSQSGTAVEILAYGITNADKKSRRMIASGAPASGRGAVHLDGASAATGEPSIAPATINAPGSSPNGFGSALLGAEIRTGTMVWTGVKFEPIRFGEEMLVGAPGTSNQETGAVYWYHSSYLQPYYVYGGKFQPPGVPDGARFGATLAAPHHLDSNYPTSTETTAPSWIAIGAPGASRVYIAAVNVGSPNPLTLSMTLYGPANTDFGASLSIADFDQDGDQDLAVGAPDGDGGRGMIYVYPGLSGSPPLDDPGRRTFDSAAAGCASAEEFGAAMDAGTIFVGDPSWPGLVIGDPLADSYADTDCGCVSQVQFDGALNVVFRRWDFGTYGSYAEFGSAVAVGNFLAQDGDGSTSSDCAIAEEIAVGAPEESNGFASNGVVAIYEACVDATGGALANDPAVELYGTEDSDRVGSSLASDFVQRTVHEDLVIGRPTRGTNRGGYRLTKAGPSGGLDDDFSGVWTGDDSSGSPFSLQVTWVVDDSATDVLNVTMLNSANLRLEDNFGSGSVCSLWGVNADFTGIVPIDPLDWEYPGSGDHSEALVMDISSLVGVPAEVHGTLSYFESRHEFEIDFDESAGILSWLASDCRVVNEPFVFSQVSSVSCE